MIYNEASLKCLASRLRSLKNYPPTKYNGQPMTAEEAFAYALWVVADELAGRETPLGYELLHGPIK